MINYNGRSYHSVEEMPPRCSVRVRAEIVLLFRFYRRG